MQNSENIDARKTLKEMGPYLNLTKLAAECDCHPNTVKNYIQGSWSDERLGRQITRAAKKHFKKLKEKINAIEIPSPVQN